MSRRLIATASIILLLIGCRSDSGRSNSDTNSSVRDVLACPTNGSVVPTESALNLVNGRTTGEFRSVVLLGAVRKYGSTYRRSTCTGTFVGSDTIVTAAHCLDGSVDGGLTYIQGDRFETVKEFLDGMNRGIKPMRAIFSGKYGENLDPNKIEDRRQDFAFLIMPGNIAPAVTPLLDHQPGEADPVTLVGYGAQSIEHPEESLAIAKRYGYNRVRLSYPGVSGGGLFIDGRSIESSENRAAIDTMSAPGDSGGPMFVRGAVAGVTTGGFVDPNDRTRAAAVYLDANIDESLDLIRRAEAAGAHIQRSAEGPIQSAPFTSPELACSAVVAGNP